MKRKKHLADFFDPHQDLILEAEIFCMHSDSKDWFYYTYGMTIREALEPAKYKAAELEQIRKAMTTYADRVLEQLEGYEEYEWCTEVKRQTKKIYHELYELEQKIR